jgi:hypothetical protein
MKNFALFLLIVALLCGIGYFVMTKINTNFNLVVWQGYSSYASFSKAVDVDEFLGRPLDEEGFNALIVLSLFFPIMINILLTLLVVPN